jgi:hypothetical protein
MNYKKYTFHQISRHNIIKDNGWGSNAARMEFTKDTHNYDAKREVKRHLGKQTEVEGNLSSRIWISELNSAGSIWGPVMGSHEHSDEHFRFLISRGERPCSMEFTSVAGVSECLIEKSDCGLL